MQDYFKKSVSPKSKQQSFYLQSISNYLTEYINKPYKNTLQINGYHNHFNCNYSFTCKVLALYKKDIKL